MATVHEAGLELTSEVGHHDDRGEVAAYFNLRSSYWNLIYEDRGCDGVIYRDRLTASLRWIVKLAVPPGARALDVGCGAGLATVALAERGYRVDAVDVARAMIMRARALAADRGLEGRIHFHHGDVDVLGLPEASYHLVLGLGILPWVPRPLVTMRVLARLLTPGGHLLVSADSRWCLSHVLDPGRNPLTRRLAWFVERLATRYRPDASRAAAVIASPPVQRHSLRDVDGWIETVGLKKCASTSVGFGPFTFMDRKLFASATSVQMHMSLQALANRRLPIVDHAGAHYLVLAKKEVRPVTAAGVVEQEADL